MLPVTTVFPEFVPDQLLTSDDLNNLFGYLDEQGRMTRTNLIGIGIVCGLEVRLNAAKNEITITKGTGVTSAGYLVTVDTVVYKAYTAFDPLKEKYYDKFVNMGTPKTKKFDLWELKEATTDNTALTETFLTDKVVLLFVELLVDQNKNCDPNSCDDKGRHINVNFRPLLVSRTNAATLIGATGAPVVDNYSSLPEVRMRRFDVLNTSPVTSEKIFQAYTTILTNTFITSVETALSQAWTRFSPYVQSEYPTNPFTGLAAGFAYINNGSISTEQLRHIQYIYDHFSDLLQAYNEFRKTGRQVLSICCPDSSLFPRHLLLGEAIPLATGNVSAYRHYFIYSPLFEQRNLLTELKILFKRLVLLMQKFTIPSVMGGSPTSGVDPYIRVTPSLLGDVPLSEKAIPYYYQVTTGPAPLYMSWNPQKTLRSMSHRNLSYYAATYNTTEEFINKPLLYDLEPNNFLRIEGIVGKPYTKVLQNVQSLIDKNRLPVDVIALNTQNTNFWEGLDTETDLLNVTGVIDDLDLDELSCNFQDLESLYKTTKHEVLCSLCKELKYYYDLKYTPAPANAVEAPTKVVLFDDCNKPYIVKPDTYGFLIEKLYGIVGDTGNITYQIITNLLGLQSFLGGDSNNDGKPDRLNTYYAAYLQLMTAWFEIPIYIIRLGKTFTETLSDFDVKEYCRIHALLVEKANTVKFTYNIFSYGEDDDSNNKSENLLFGSFLSQSTNSNLQAILSLEDMFDHLDTLIYSCKCSAFKAMKTTYIERAIKLTMLRQFGYFTQKHPGIQHKAGVPMGGTFIVVYHSRETRVTRGKVKGDFGVNGIVIGPNDQPVRDAYIYDINDRERRLGRTNQRGAFSIRFTEMPITIEVEGIGFDSKIVTITNARTLLIQLGVDENQEPEKAIDGITPGTVIADFYLPYRCCSDCSPIQYVVTEPKEPPPVNQGPVANAGNDQVITLPTNSVTLNGSGSTDADGSITQFAWVRVSGPGSPQIVTANSSQTSVTGLVQGEYVFELTVTDDKGATAKDTVKITVNPTPRVNQPPVANAGADRTFTLAATNALTLDGSASSDPEGATLQYNWQRNSGPNTPAIISPSSAITSVAGLVAGVYEFRLTVTDPEGLSHADTVVITVVLPANVPPVANAGIDQSITLPVNSVTLNGSASQDPDGAIVSVSWKMLSGPGNAVIGAATSSQTQVSSLQQGTYVFELTVTDNRGAAATDTVTITVDPAKEKSCAPLQDIIDLFEKLKDIDPNRWDLFIRMFQYYPQVAAYFNQMVEDKIPSRSIEKQIEFFATPIGGATIEAMLIEWLKQLQGIILNNTENMRLLALAMYRVLMQLAMYISCIQPEDVDKAKVRMAEVFETIVAHAKEWAESHKKKEWDKASLEMIRQILADLKAEESRIISNGEGQTKPMYLKFIRELISILDSMV